MYFRESAILGIDNPVIQDFSKPITEAVLADLKLKEVRAIYPLIKAINSNRLTRNFTFYPAESLIGKNNKAEPTGFYSFVKPFGKPILTEHRDMDIWNQADAPMGRVVFSGFKKRDSRIEGPSTPPIKSYIPGTVEGDGSLYVVPAITHPESITRVLGGAYHTVSIGCNVKDVWESITSKNIAKMRRDGEDPPEYERGQLYEGKLCYWKMGEIQGIEVSFVNVPSDEYARVVDPDIGEEGIRLLVAERKSGKNNEYSFFDASTSEKIDLDFDFTACDESFFIDSADVGHNIWWLSSKTSEVTESVEISNQKISNEEAMKKESINLQELAFSDLVTNVEVLNKEDLISTFSTDKDVSKLVAGDGTGIQNSELFKSISEFISDIFDGWTIESAKVALSIYEREGGEYSTEEKTKEKSSIGYKKEDGKVILTPLVVKNGEEFTPLVEIRNKEQLSEFLNSLDMYNLSYKIWSDKESMEEFSKSLKALENDFENEIDESVYVELGISNLLNFISNKEKDDSSKYLAMLAGAVRKRVISKTDLEESHTAYCVFGNSILKKFIDTASEKTEDEKSTTKSETIDVVQSPISASEVTSAKKEDNKLNNFLTDLTLRRKNEKRNPYKGKFKEN